MADIICTTMVDREKFTWNKKTKTYSAEISDLGDFEPTRIYADAADSGFTMVRDIDEKATFAYAETHREKRRRRDPLDVSASIRVDQKVDQSRWRESGYFQRLIHFVVDCGN
jgi:hypothetical protein